MLKRNIKKFRNVLLKIFLLFTLLILPIFAYSQSTVTPKSSMQSSFSISYKLYTFVDILNSIVILIMSLAVVYFLIGLLKYISSKTDAERQKGRGYIVNGIIILFIMASMWSIVYLFKETFQIGDFRPGSKQINVNNLIKR